MASNRNSLAVWNGATLLVSISISLGAVTAARAQVDISINSANKDECADACSAVVGVPGCGFAYFYDRLKPPICRVTSHSAPDASMPGTYKIWSARDGRYLVEADFEAGGIYYAGVEPDRVGLQGYYVVRKSGSGWLKHYAGAATYVSGYRYLAIRAVKGLTKPQKKYYWEFPVKYDLTAQFDIWTQEAIDASKASCKSGKPSSGAVVEPRIWVDGPHFEVVYGPHSGVDMPPAFGSPRIDNGKPGSALQWDHKAGYSHDDVKARCAALGIP